MTRRTLVELRPKDDWSSKVFMARNKCMTRAPAHTGTHGCTRWQVSQASIRRFLSRKWNNTSRAHTPRAMDHKLARWRVIAGIPIYSQLSPSLPGFRNVRLISMVYLRSVTIIQWGEQRDAYVLLWQFKTNRPKKPSGLVMLMPWAGAKMSLS